MNDLDNKEYIQMEAALEYMTDEQVSRLVDQLDTVRLIGLISYLTPVQTERVISAIKSENQRNLIEQVIKNRDTR